MIQISTMLMSEAINKRDHQELERLINSGSPVNEKVSLLASGLGKTVYRSNPKFHGTLLHLAVYRHDHEAVKKLLRAGADVHAVDYLGSTPLKVACELRLVNIIQTLVNYHAIPFSKDKYSEHRELFIESHRQMFDISFMLASNNEEFLYLCRQQSKQVFDSLFSNDNMSFDIMDMMDIYTLQ